MTDIYDTDINDSIVSKEGDSDNECEEYIFKSPNKLTREEREFYLNYNEAIDCWYAESSIPKYWRKLEKQGWICTNITYYADGTVCSKQFKSGSRKGVTITNPFKTRVVTDEQREQARNRFKQLHKQTADDIDTDSDDNFEEED